MNEFILFKIAEITTCYKLISTYYKVHCELRYFVLCHVILGANKDCKLPLNVNRSHTSISVLEDSHCINYDEPTRFIIHFIIHESQIPSIAYDVIYAYSLKNQHLPFNRNTFLLMSHPILKHFFCVNVSL